ncbi:MAG: hypothetical protein AB8B51_17505 [Sedimentitalea sp.]
MSDQDDPDPKPLFPLGATFQILNGFAVYGAAPVVVLLVWWVGLTARLPAMTALSAASFFLVSTMALSSFQTLGQARAKSPEQKRWKNLWLPIMAALFAVWVLCAPIWVTHFPQALERLTHGTLFKTATAIKLRGANIVLKPTDWLPSNLAERDFREIYCKRTQQQPCQEEIANWSQAFLDEWDQRRRHQIAALLAPDMTFRNLSHAKYAQCIYGWRNF